MSNDNFQEDCPECHWDNVTVLEYDADEDKYLMQCDECDHKYWADNDDAVWK